MYEKMEMECYVTISRMTKKKSALIQNEKKLHDNKLCSKKGKNKRENREARNGK